MLRIDNINLKTKDKHILKDIDLNFQRGFVYAILGPNGAGKSSLLKTITKLVEPTFGDVIIFHKSLKTIKSISEHIAFLAQEHSTNQHLDVLEVVVMGLLKDIKSKPSKEHYEKAKNVLKELGLSHLIDREFTSLSGGEKRLVLMARALVKETSILILDEPTNHLDFKNKHSLLGFVKNITKSKHMISIMTLHEPDIAFYYSDSLILMKDGKVFKYGDKYEVFKEEYITILYDVNVSIKIEKDYVCIKPKL